MGNKIGTTLDGKLLYPEDITPYVIQKGKKVFKLHINRHSRNWLGAIHRIVRRIVDRTN